MNAINLTSEENKELKRRGFLILENPIFSSLLKSTLSLLLVMPIFSWILWLLGIFIWIYSYSILSWIANSLWFPILPNILLIFFLIYQYSTTSAIFYSERWLLWSWATTKKEIMRKNLKVSFFSKIIVYLWKIFSFFWSIRKDWWWLVIPGIITLTLFSFWNIWIWNLLIDAYWEPLNTIVNTFSQIYQTNWLLERLVLGFGVSIVTIIGTVLMSLIGKYLFKNFHPLYAFGNLWEKIQSLTPRISEQSKQIESEFRWDMDFRVLSKSFDSLASTFSDIVSLVIKLEKVEHKANKWDLFDSKKYIDSLRTDIRNPLSELKKFLEKKRKELQVSQEELMRVLVSVGWGWENRELQSVRATELMKELDENIGKLDMMLEKL